MQVVFLGADVHITDTIDEDALPEAYQELRQGCWLFQQARGGRGTGARQPEAGPGGGGDLPPARAAHAQDMVTDMSNQWAFWEEHPNW